MRLAELIAYELSVWHRLLDDPPQMKAYLEQSIALGRVSGDELMTVEQLINLAEIYRAEGDMLRSVALLDEMIRLSRRRGASMHIAMGLANLGATYLDAGDYGQARDCLTEALLRFRDAPWSPFCLVALEAMAGLSIVEGDAERGARLLGAADSLLEAYDETREFNDLAVYERHVQAARSALGAPAYSLAYAGGRLLDRDAAIREAFGLTHGSAPQP
jgi:tetratricopeptide (TPR) repeat protein